MINRMIYIVVFYLSQIYFHTRLDMFRLEKYRQYEDIIISIKTQKKMFLFELFSNILLVNLINESVFSDFYRLLFLLNICYSAQKHLDLILVLFLGTGLFFSRIYIIPLILLQFKYVNFKSLFS